MALQVGETISLGQVQTNKSLRPQASHPLSTAPTRTLIHLTGFRFRRVAPDYGPRLGCIVWQEGLGSLRA
jgi:hypothetical protein